MIWIFILVPLVVASFILFLKKMPFQYYFVLLLPIQLYGLTTPVVTVKPFMVFGFGLFIYSLIKFRKSLLKSLPLSLTSLFVFGVAFGFLLLADVLNRSIPGSLSYLILMGLAFFSALSFLFSIQDLDDPLGKLCTTLLVAGLVYSCYFIAIFYLAKRGFARSVLIVNRSNQASLAYGVVGEYLTSGLADVQYRLRGFSVDPNEFCSFFFGPFALFEMRLLMAKDIKKMIFYGLGTIAILWVIYLSGSRTGLVVALVLFLAMFLIIWGQLEKKKRMAILIVLGLGFVALIGGVAIKGVNFLSGILGRSSVTDEYGRFSIWGNAVNVWLSKNILFGIGQGVFTNDLGLDCHNTWLEILVGNGIIGGTPLIIAFIYSFWVGIANTRSYSNRYGLDSSLFGVFLLSGGIAACGSAFTYTFLASPDIWFYVALALFIGAKMSEGKKTIHLYRV